MTEARVAELRSKMHEIATAWEKTDQRGLVEVCIDQLEGIHARYIKLRTRLVDMRELRDALQEEFDKMHRDGIYGENKRRPLDAAEQEGYEIVVSDLEEHNYFCIDLERKVQAEVDMMDRVVTSIEKQLEKNHRDAH